MEAEMTYVAKDGRRFNDALQCEQYEKKLGVLPGSVGELVSSLKELDAKCYVHGIVFVVEGDKRSIFTWTTLCVDDLLEDYVNVKDLGEEKRYARNTVGQMIERFSKLDQDAPCQYTFIYSENLSMNPCGVMFLYNPKVWEKKEGEK